MRLRLSCASGVGAAGGGAGLGGTGAGTGATGSGGVGVTTAVPGRIATINSTVLNGMGGVGYFTVTRKLLDHASTLTDQQLDQQVPSAARVFGWEQPDQNVREILERLVITKEVGG